MGLDSGLQVNFPGFLTLYTTNIQMEGGWGGYRTTRAREQSERENKSNKTLGTRQRREKRRHKRRRGGKPRRSPRFELPPSGLSFRNKNLIMWLFFPLKTQRQVCRENCRYSKWDWFGSRFGSPWSISSCGSKWHALFRLVTQCGFFPH